MDRPDLSDRIVVYADTIVAFSVVNGFAFLVALGEPDIRCSIVSVGVVVSLLDLAIPIGSTIALVWLGRMQRRFRHGKGRHGEGRNDEEREREEDDDVTAHFWRVIVRVRMALVWIFGLLVFFGIHAARFDARCIGSLE